LKTGSHARNTTATVVVINNLTANTGNNNIDNGSSNAGGGYSTIKNIVAPNGSFFIKYQFLQPGTHQIITRINSNDDNNTFSALASFNVIVLPPD